ncbi:MAG: fasciclin domain-containing protein, partial [Flavobacteriaceae bacterium]|nr:fasciclin domain-containing protein [Flavobacteriaceae bacterium]
MKTKIFAIALLFSFVFSSCNTEKKQDAVKSDVEQVQKAVKDHGQAGVAAAEGEQPNALQVAKSIEDFSTLVAAIEAAGVQDAVVNAGP